MDQNQIIRLTPVADRSICISTTSPSMKSTSSFIRIPILRLRACVRASVLDNDNENTSEAAIIVKGTSLPSACAMPNHKQRINKTLL